MRPFTIATAVIARAAPDITRAEGAGTVAEIVTFHLVTGADPADFATAAAGMTPFLKSTRAVLSRTLSVDAQGLWTDHLIWTDMIAATEAAARMMQNPAAAPFMALIDPETVTMRHAEILFAQPPE